MVKLVGGLVLMGLSAGLALPQQFNAGATIQELQEQAAQAIKQYQSEDFPYPADLLRKYQADNDAVLKKYTNYQYAYNALNADANLERIQQENEATLKKLQADSLAVIKKYAYQAPASRRRRRSPQLVTNANVATLQAQTAQTLKELRAQTAAAVKQYETEDFPYPAASIEMYSRQNDELIAKFSNIDPASFQYTPERAAANLAQIQSDAASTLASLRAQTADVLKQYQFTQNTRRRRSAQQYSAAPADNNNNYEYVPEDAAALIEKYQKQNEQTIKKYTNYQWDPSQQPEYSGFDLNTDPEGLKKFISGLRGQSDLVKAVVRLTSGQLFNLGGDSAAADNNGCGVEALSSVTDKLAETLASSEPQLEALTARARSAGYAGSNGNTIRVAAGLFEDISALIPSLTSALSVEGCDIATSEFVTNSGLTDAEAQEGLKKSVQLTRAVTRIAAAANGATLTTLCSDNPEFTNSIVAGAEDLLSTFGNLFADFGDVSNAAKIQQSAASLRSAASSVPVRSAYNGQATCETPVSEVSAILNDVAEIADQTAPAPYAAAPAPVAYAPALVATAYAPAPAAYAQPAPAAYVQAAPYGALAPSAAYAYAV